MNNVYEVILLSSSYECDAQVEIMNCSTGQSYDSDAIIGTSPLMFSLFGEGQYVITITLASGQVYEGEFVL